jgi:hypothetical protein
MHARMNILYPACMAVLLGQDATAEAPDQFPKWRSHSLKVAYFHEAVLLIIGHVRCDNNNDNKQDQVP